MGQKREEKIPLTPGPGQYELGKEEKKGVTIGTRPHEKQQEELPGPGQYDAKLRESTTTYSIGQKREDKIRETPGPGQYEIITEQKKGVTIGTRK